MQYLLEYSDTFTTPYEAFFQDTGSCTFPVKPHWHYFTEIIYIMEGSTMVDCSDASYILETGDLFLFPPRSIHSIYSTKWAALRYAVIKFDANALNVTNSYTPKLQSVLDSVRNNPGANLCFPAADIKNLPIESLFTDCIRELSDKQYGYDIQVHIVYRKVREYSPNF
ncbi:MAG TPA: AraC family ligand binding domain-containing protein, partial [Lachnospiraceae bacterium]|nr:AraC family ligand binding domain-containing protein [Lachnospiraceae bacterium]